MDESEVCIPPGNRQVAKQAVSNKVYTVIVPRTMFEQCLPDNSVDLAISSVATHYLSKQYVSLISRNIFFMLVNRM